MEILLIMFVILAVKDKKAKKKQINLLDLIPVQTCDWSYQEKSPELVRILKPRFDSKLGKRFGKRFNVKETFNINLDEYGTAIWRLIDGQLTVGELGEILATQFGDKVEPLFPRLAQFLRILEGQHAIELKKSGVKRKIKKI